MKFDSKNILSYAIVIILFIVFSLLSQAKVTLSCSSLNKVCTYVKEYKVIKKTTTKTFNINEVQDVERRKYTRRSNGKRRTSYEYYIVLRNSDDISISKSLYIDFSNYYRYPTSDFYKEYTSIGIFNN